MRKKGLSRLQTFWINLPWDDGAVGLLGKDLAMTAGGFIPLNLY
jgi:hypothetical protein